MENWNRKTKRKMSKYGIGQEALNKGIDEAYRKGEENASRFAFAGMILALVDHFNFPQDRIHDLAVCTMRIINSSFCPTELICTLKEKTGFDVDEPLQEFELLEDSDENLA